jgi:transcription antitermination factor NusG
MTRGTLDLGAWCILRCSNGKTLELAASLTDAGFEAWSPRVIVVKRAGPSRKRETVTLAIMPGYVFASYSHVAELLELARSPSLLYRVWDSGERRMVTKGHPHFSVYREFDRVPWIRDRSLDPLREAEQVAKPRAQRATFAPGSKVSHPASGFEGMIGTVQGGKGRKLLVSFSDPSRPALSIPVEIEPHKLIAA